MLHAVCIFIVCSNLSFTCKAWTFSGRLQQRKGSFWRPMSIMCKQMRGKGLYMYVRQAMRLGASGHQLDGQARQFSKQNKR
ncbi:hypothetical protein K437DRAFT_175626 [Tilletiaria anomala UBC 951]|uniref:Secreted protein n=1 Tax=Tilletiaria anomala (strain ATCC 24038 / CBS 436.72 / UBC 951) TaxID=1037660 RepID=A0A066WNS8_TILAU|nr:uncharacterized protein K437DRAFT_175626 [Tilletiaria anomala UBC 951]KDN52659.1 hypothetical protein K437DRAFT_175626 [Tilletiaria anomala UBC 951]